MVAMLGAHVESVTDSFAKTAYQDNNIDGFSGVVNLNDYDSDLDGFMMSGFFNLINDIDPENGIEKFVKEFDADKRQELVNNFWSAPIDERKQSVVDSLDL